MTNSSPPPPTQRIPSSSQPSLPSVSMTASATPETTRADFQCGASLMRLPSALAENYTLIEHLPTKGAEADIFLVEHRPTGDKSIAKVYRRDIECKPDLLERLRGLDSRHVVQIIGHGKSDGHWFELMEYLPFGTLDVYLNRHTPHSEETRRAVLKELHDALRYLHANGIFHRDLKPENILIREEDPLRLVFSDFGIASLSEASIRFTRGAGTLHYAAPEQIVAAATVTGKTDYWSLGMILFEMLAGRHPFSELGEYAIAAVIATGSTGTGGNLPFETIADPKWRTLCQGLLVRDPQQRWGSDEVGRWLQGDETLKVSSQRPENSVHPYTFNGQKHYDLENLAEALASDWSNAIKDFHRGYLSNWFSGALFNQELARKADEILENEESSADEKLSALLIEITGSYKLYWKGNLVTNDILINHAKKSLQGDFESKLKIKEIFFNFICSNFIKFLLKKKNNVELLFNTLESDFDEFEKEWPTIKNKNNYISLEPEKELIVSFIILANLDKEFENEIRRGIDQKLPEEIKETLLIKNIGNSIDCSVAKLLILYIITDHLVDKFNKKLTSKIETIQDEIAHEVIKIKQDFPKILEKNNNIEKRINLLLEISNSYKKINKLNTRNLGKNLQKLKKIKNIVLKIRENIISKYPEREVLYINIRKLVEEYGDLIFKNERTRKKFTFVQKAEENGNKEDIAKSFEYLHKIEFELQRYIYEKGDFTLNQAKSKLKYFEKKYSYLIDKGEIKEKIRSFNRAVEKKQYGIIISFVEYVTTFEKNFIKFQKIEQEAFYGKVETQYKNLINELKIKNKETDKKLTKEEEDIIKEKNKVLDNLHSYNFEKMEESLKKMKLIIENFDRKSSTSSKIEESPSPSPSPKVVFIKNNFELLNKNIETLKSFYIKKLKLYENILESVNSNEFEFIDNDLADLEILRKEIIINNNNYIEFLKLTEKKYFKSKNIKSLEKNIFDNIDNYFNNKNNFDTVTLVNFLELELIKYKNICLSRKNILNKIVEYFR